MCYRRRRQFFSSLSIFAPHVRGRQEAPLTQNAWCFPSPGERASGQYSCPHKWIVVQGHTHVNGNGSCIGIYTGTLIRCMSTNAPLLRLEKFTICAVGGTVGTLLSNILWFKLKGAGHIILCPTVTAVNQLQPLFGRAHESPIEAIVFWQLTV